MGLIRSIDDVYQFIEIEFFQEKQFHNQINIYICILELLIPLLIKL